MIGKGSMVALKGHAQFPMVVSHVGVNVPVSQYRRGMDDNFAAVVWLDRHGVPHEETYSLELLEELDDVADTETAPKPPLKGLPTGSFHVDGEWHACVHCRKQHIPQTPCKDPQKATRQPGDPQSLTHGIQAVRRWSKGHGNG